MTEIDLDRLKDLVLGKDGAAFDTRTGRSYRLNPSGELALRLLQEGQPEEEVVRQLAGRFAQHPAVVTAGAEAFVGQLRRYLP
jgi:hypothetical protein